MPLLISLINPIYTTDHVHVLHTYYIYITRPISSTYHARNRSTKPRKHLLPQCGTPDAPLLTVAVIDPHAVGTGTTDDDDDDDDPGENPLV